MQAKLTSFWEPLCALVDIGMRTLDISSIIGFYWLPLNNSKEIGDAFSFLISILSGTIGLKR